MFDNEDAVVRVDMSEFMEKHSVSKMIGSLQDEDNRITIDGKQFMSIEPKPAYVPLFA